jgi:hypothetical protein
VCVKVEVVDAPLEYNILLGWSWTYAITSVSSIIFWVLCFPHEGWILTINQLSVSHPDPSSGSSTVRMIDNPLPGTVNLGVGLLPYLMGNSDYIPHANDVNFISVVSNQPKVAIFQVASFRASYFNNLWILPSTSTSRERVGNPRMDIPLSVSEVVYSIVQQASTNPDLAPP